MFSVVQLLFSRFYTIFVYSHNDIMSFLLTSKAVEYDMQLWIETLNHMEKKETLMMKWVKNDQELKKKT